MSPETTAPAPVGSTELAASTRPWEDILFDRSPGHGRQGDAEEPGAQDRVSCQLDGDLGADGGQHTPGEEREEDGREDITCPRGQAYRSARF